MAQLCSPYSNEWHYRRAYRKKHSWASNFLLESPVHSSCKSKNKANFLESQVSWVEKQCVPTVAPPKSAWHPLSCEVWTRLNAYCIHFESYQIIFLNKLIGQYYIPSCKFNLIFKVHVGSLTYVERYRKTRQTFWNAAFVYLDPAFQHMFKTP